MKKFKVFFILFFIFIVCNNVIAYEINEYEDVTNVYIVPEDEDTSNFVVKPNLESKEYVRNYKVGEYTAIQICEVGGKSCEHSYNVGEEYVLNEIIDIKYPTCLEDGYMTIKCKYPVSDGFLGMFKKECEKTQTLVLDRIRHFVSEESINGECEYCGEIHNKKELLKGEEDIDYHYYSCSYNGCTEKIREEHISKKDEESGKWFCIICNIEDTRHKETDIWGADLNYHYKMCAVEGCDERFNEELHVGGTHNNDGECEICLKKYQTHNRDRTRVYINDAGHTYRCSYDGCGEVFFSEHIKSDEIDWNGESHWYKCIDSDCEKRISQEKHYSGKNDDGICEVCKRKYDGKLDKFYLKDFEDGFIRIDEVGDKLKLEVEYYPENLADDNFLWEIEDEEIANITQNGVIRGISEGITILHIKWNDYEIKYPVYVGVDTFEIKVDKSSIVEGEKAKISIVTENIIGDIDWSIEPKGWATINKNGEIIAKKGGGNELTIYAKIHDLVGTTTIKIEHGEVSHEEDGGKCEKCLANIEGHNLSNEYYFDENEHWKTCENKECKNEKINKGKHTYSTSCKVCGWHKKVEETNNNQTGTNQSGTQPVTNPSNPDISVSVTPNSGPNSWQWRSNNTQHWKVSNATGKILGAKSSHNYVSGKCECGKIKEEIVCDHKNKGTYKEFIGEGKHGIYCSFCDAKIKEETCLGETCECRTFETKKAETSLELPIKVYYIEEDGLISVEGDQVDSIKVKVESKNEPKYSWTMSTIPGQTFFSENNDIANDGTIIFWHEDGVFKAKLIEDERAVLSEEVEVKVTLLDGSSRDFETIKLIKNGPPRSYCQVYIENPVISFEDNKIRLVIATKYNEFDEEEVRNGGKNEFPLYEVKDSKIKITSKNQDILEVPSSCITKEVTDGSFNGYIAKIDATPKKNGRANIEIELTTEYTVNNHKTIEKQRKYSANIVVSEDAEEVSGSVGTGEGTGVVLPEITEDEGEDGRGVSTSGALAIVGVITLLLVAIVGAKMFGHH